MDLLSITAALLSTLTLINTAVDVAQEFRKALVDDSRFNTIYFTLMGEKRKYEAWANNMRLVDNQIHPNDVAAVNKIKEELEETLIKAQEKFRAYSPVHGGKVQHPNIKNRAKWVLGGYDKLGDLLKLIRTLNEVLGIVAPVLPPYTLSGNVPIQSPQSTATADDTNEPSDNSLGQTAELPIPLFNNVLRKFFDTCLNGPKLIGLAEDGIGDLARSHLYRLRLWGTGLFDDALSLEELLYASRKYTESLHTFLLEAFVDIAITEEQILRRWASDTSHFNQPALNTARMQITSILGTEEVARMTREKWQVMLEEEAEVGEYSDEQDIEVLRKTIEVLFDMQPAIRSVRRGYILEIEALERPESPDGGMTVTSTKKSSDTGFENLIDKNLEQVAIIEKAARMQEKAFQAQGRKNHIDDKKTVSRVRESQEVGKVQGELSRELARFFDANSGRLLTESQSSRELNTSSGKTPLKSEGLELDPADLERLANLFDMAASHLFTVSEG